MHLVAFEPAGPWIRFQQPVDGAGVQPGAVGQAFGCPACRRAQRHIHALGSEHLQNGVHQGGLADARAAGDHQHLRLNREPKRLSLARRQHQPGLALHPGYRLGGIDHWPWRSAGGQEAQPLGNDLLRAVEPGQERTRFAVHGVGNQLAVLQLQPERGLDQFSFYLDQLGCAAEQLGHRQPAMPIPGGLGKPEGQPGPHPDHRVLGDAELERDLIGGAEADTADVARQAVGVLRDKGDRLLTIGLEDPHRARRADAVGMQEQHDLADRLLIRPAGDDPGGTLGADTGYLAQPLRLLLNEVEHRLAERTDQRTGIDRADAADHARSPDTSRCPRSWWAGWW